MCLLVKGQLQTMEDEDFILLIEKIVLRVRENEVEMWEMIVWAIWNARNRFHFEASQTRLY
jgi:hypothetical protein